MKRGVYFLYGTVGMYIIEFSHEDRELLKREFY